MVDGSAALLNAWPWGQKWMPLSEGERPPPESTFHDKPHHATDDETARVMTLRDMINADILTLMSIFNDKRNRQASTAALKTVGENYYIVGLIMKFTGESVRIM